MKKATVSTLLDQRRKLKSSKFPLKLSVYHDGGKKRYSTGIELTLEEYNKIQGKKLKDGKLKKIRSSIQSIIVSAEETIAQMKTFSFDEFDFFYHAKSKSNTVSLRQLYKIHINRDVNPLSIKTKTDYQSSLNSILGFEHGTKGSSLNDLDMNVLKIDASYLSKYEAHMKAKSKSNSTVGVYLRSLRAVINTGIKKDFLKNYTYPFENYKIPASKNIKKALSTKQIIALKSYTSADENVTQSLNYWILIYYLGGINFKDLARLRKEDYQDGFITFLRNKTINTSKANQKPIRLPVPTSAKALINKLKCTDINAPYLFPIVKNSESAECIEKDIYNFAKLTRKYLKVVAKDLGINVTLGGLSARHSYATAMLRSEVPLSFISNQLGHKSILTTQNYLDSIEDSKAKEYTNLL